MKHILYVHHGKGIGGAPLSLLYTIREIERSAYEPTVFCIHESEATDLFRREGIEVIVRPEFKDFSHTNVLWYPWWQFPKTFIRLLHVFIDAMRLAKFFRKHQFEIVHLNTSTLLSFGLAAKRCGIPVVWHIREPLHHGYFGIRRFFIRRIIHRCADAVIPISHYDASQLLPSDRIHVVYNFIDFNQFDHQKSPTALRSELAVGEATPVVLMLGGFNKIKGTFVFVKAAVKILRELPDALFLIAGDIPDATMRNRLNGRWSYVRRVRKAIPQDFANRIIALGNRSDIPELIAASSVLCFPSTVAHFARPIIEASAMAKPVVASDIGGPRELVLNNETGFLVPPGSPDKLAQALLRLLRDEELRERVGKAGLDFAQRNFDAKKNIRQIMDLYRQLMEVKSS